MIDFSKAGFPGESADYRAARNQLLDREIELRRLTEAVAAERRALPPGGVIDQDYAFSEANPDGSVSTVPLSELFANGNDTVAIYSYMFGPERESPCPMCTPLLDGLNGVAEHIEQRVSLVVVAESAPERLAAWASQRGWQRLRLMSAAGTSYNRDYHGTEDFGDTTMLNVFHRSGGTIRHFWATELASGPSDPGQHHRGLDPVNPIFNFFDFTPEGRGAHCTQLSYS